MRPCAVERFESRAVVSDDTAAMKELMRNDIAYSFNIVESITGNDAKDVRYRTSPVATAKTSPSLPV